MFKGFREFVLRGNVIELAIAVVMGTAFNAIVTTVTNSLLKPLINAVRSTSVSGLTLFVRHDASGNPIPATGLDFAAVINSAINFLIIAMVIYFALVLPMNKIVERRKRKLGLTDEDQEALTETELLTEIRDLLREQAGSRQH